MQNRSKKANDSLFKPWHLVLLVLIGIGGLYWSYGAMKKAYTYDPEKTFAQFFSNRRDRIDSLKGDGTISSMSDVWLTFHSGDVIRWQNPKLVTVENPNRSWHWFSEKFPNDKSVFNLQDLEAWSYYDHPDPVKLVNAWLIHNKKTNEYWFRTWGRQ